MVSNTFKYLIFKYFCALTVVFFISAGSKGQSYLLTRYTTKNGLAHDNVRDIAIDSTGFIWLATWDGVSRFDGLEFRNYFHVPGDSTTIPYFSVRRLSIDKLNNLWVFVEDGQLCRFDRSLENFRVIKSLNGYSVERLKGMITDQKGNLIFILEKKVLYYDPASDKTEEFLLQYQPDLGFNPFDNIHRTRTDDSGRLWLMGNDVLEISLKRDSISGKNLAVILYHAKLFKQSDSERLFYDFSNDFEVYEDVDRNMWLASNTGLFHLDKTRNIFTDYLGDVSGIKFKTSKPVTFYRPNDGVSIFYPGTDTLINIPKRLCNLPLNIFAQDKDLFWFSSVSPEGMFLGLTKVEVAKNEFKLINPFPDADNETSVYGVREDREGAIWIAARDKPFIIRILRNGTIEKINELYFSERKAFGYPRSFLEDKDGMWIGYYFKCLIHYDYSTHKVTRYHPAAEYFHTLCSDGKGHILIGDNPIKSFDPVSGRTDTIARFPQNIIIYNLELENDSILWAGASYSSVIRLNLKTGASRIDRVCKDSYNVEDVCPGSGSEVWLALLGGGICRYNYSTGKSEFFTTSAGLSNNTTYSLLKDNNGNIWVSTNNGISVIESKNSLVIAFGQNEGLTIHEFNADAVYESDDGKFYMGGIGGVVRFDPDQILSNESVKNAPSIFITDFRVSGEERYLDRPLYETDTLTLQKGENNFHLSFTTLEFKNPDILKFRYRFNGINDKWTVTNSRDRNINYSNLKPGWYNLEIQSTDKTGAWRSAKILTVHVKPFFYQTRWFKIILPIIIVLISISIIVIYIRQIRLRERQTQNRLRLESLRGQMNPHFIFNSLNSINYFISNNDKISANRYIADFSKLIRAILDTMQSDYISMEKEIESIKGYLTIEHLRFGDKFDYEIIVDEKIDVDSTYVAPGLIQPFIENAIWHGVRGLVKKKGKISVRFILSEGKIVCYIEDNGIGRAKSEALKDKRNEKKSRGISIVNDRIRIINSITSSKYNYHIDDLYPGQSEPGTLVIVDLPVR